jgi:hypothetical protein
MKLPDHFGLGDFKRLTLLAIRDPKEAVITLQTAIKTMNGFMFLKVYMEKRTYRLIPPCSNSLT